MPFMKSSLDLKSLLDLKLLLGSIAVSSLVVICSAHAALPLQKKVGEFELGMSADVAMKTMEKSYPNCEIKRRNHKDDNGEISEILTEFALDAADIDKMSKQFKCEHDERAVDRVNLKFVNPDYIASQPLYEIGLKRTFGEPAGVPNSSKVTLEEIRKVLFEKYGKPSAQLRVKTTSASEAVPANKSKAKKGKSTANAVSANQDESYNVVYVWGGPGLKAQLFSFCMENCGNYYMTADLTIARKKEQLPKNTFYVQTLAIRMTDSQLDMKQYDWVYERIKRIRNKSKVY